MFSKIDGLKIFANFTGKHLCWSLFSIKLQDFRPATLLKRIPTLVFSCEICKIFKNTIFNKSPPVAFDKTTRMPLTQCPEKMYLLEVIKLPSS